MELKLPPQPLPVTPPALPIGEVLRQSEPLARLQLLMRDSDARFEAIKSALPGGLAQHVRPGPVDEAGWSLLAANASIAAKLRQLRPHLEETLRDRGWPASAIRVKVQSR
jgi:hypothetical protein